MSNGLTCKGIAMRGAAFCYHHGRASRPVRHERPSEVRIELPHLLDNESALAAINEVIQALGENRISNRRASTLLFGIQMSLTNQSAAGRSVGSSTTPPFNMSQFLSSIGKPGNHP
jgi:hypothetical protein